MKKQGQISAHVLFHGPRREELADFNFQNVSRSVKDVVTLSTTYTGLVCGTRLGKVVGRIHVFENTCCRGVRVITEGSSGCMLRSNSEPSPRGAASWQHALSQLEAATTEVTWSPGQDLKRAHRDRTGRQRKIPWLLNWGSPPRSEHFAAGRSPTCVSPPQSKITESGPLTLVELEVFVLRFFRAVNTIFCAAGHTWARNPWKFQTGPHQTWPERSTTVRNSPNVRYTSPLQDNFFFIKHVTSTKIERLIHTTTL